MKAFLILWSVFALHASSVFAQAHELSKSEQITNAETRVQTLWSSVPVRNRVVTFMGDAFHDHAFVDAVTKVKYSEYEDEGLSDDQTHGYISFRLEITTVCKKKNCSKQVMTHVFNAQLEFDRFSVYLTGTAIKKSEDGLRHALEEFYQDGGHYFYASQFTHLLSTSDDYDAKTPSFRDLRVAFENLKLLKNPDPVVRRYRCDP